MTYRALSFLLLPIALVALAFTIVFGFRVIDNISRLRSAPLDNLHWALTQTEVDHLRLLNVVHRAEHENPVSPEALNDIRLRFDILYSRIVTIRGGLVGERLKETESGTEILGSLWSFLEASTAIIDANDDTLTAALPSLRRDLETLTSDIRRMSLEAIPVFAARSDLDRQEFQRTLLIASLAAASLIFLLGLMLVFMLNQTRLARSRGRMASLSQARLAAVIESSLDAIVAADPHGRIIEYNDAARGIFGYSADAAIGRDVGELLVPPDQRNRHREAMLAHLESGHRRMLDSGRVELTALRSDGSEFPVELTVRQLDAAPGSGFVAFIRDISIQKAAAQALEQARDQALAADEAKSRFIAVMSHEMRTPLNGLLGTLDLLRDVPMPERDRDFLRVATRSGEILLRQVNDVLDLARLQKGAMNPTDEHVDLGRVIRDVIDLNRAEAVSKSIDLTAEVDDRLSAVRGDLHRIRSVLLNLVSNAVKFTDEGGVDIAARPVRTGGKEMIEILVSDSGHGVPPEAQKRIFEDFVMLDDSYGRQTAGSGLGLAISRRLVDLMNGSIDLVGSSADGSVFRVRLPYVPSRDAAERPETDEGAAPAEAPEGCLSVLLVEDNDVNRTVARSMLARNGHRVTEAADGAGALQKAATEPFDLILMDISMPGLDGLETTRRIRSEPGPNAGTPIFGLTAHAMPEEQTLFRAAGMQSCLSKPLRIETLDRALRNVEGERTPAWDHLGLLDGAVLADLDASMGRDGFRDLLQKAVGEMETRQAAILVASRSGDPALAAEQAHKLCGTASVLGTRRVIEISRRIERVARHGQPEALQEAASALSDCVSGTADALRRYADST